MKPDEPDLRARPVEVQLYDTTLRDGTQREGLSLSCADKLRVATRLDELGVHFIEAGWPGSNPKDAEFFERARDVQWKNATIAAFGSTCRAQCEASDDPQVAALLAAQTPVCTIFGKSWLLHVKDVLRIKPQDNLRMIEQTVRLLTQEGRRVVYDAEHFFDGFFADVGYALETLHAAIDGGAETVVLCDTNGGSLPWQVQEVVGRVLGDVKNHPVGIHTHNDSGCAVANALAAVRAGARQVQGTINGYGERCGNANLCSVAPALELKMKLRCLSEGSLRQLAEVSHFVTEVANLPLDDHLPYVGRSAFAHKGGVHVSAMRRHPDSYQHLDPEQVGNESRVVVSELSGRSNVVSKAEELGIEVSKGAEASVVRHIKESEARGCSYDAAEASVAMLLMRSGQQYEPLFEVRDYHVMAGQRKGGDKFVEATVKAVVAGQEFHTAAEGNGPVSALDAALRKALQSVFPELSDIHLADYKVRILGESDGTSATTRVLIDHRRGMHGWSTMGASANIIEASLTALVDGIEFGLLKLGQRKDDEQKVRPLRSSRAQVTQSKEQVS